eukprot:Clim_evm70s11 gene=Clim_evmTU70s11
MASAEVPKQDLTEQEYEEIVAKAMAEMQKEQDQQFEMGQPEMSTSQALFGQTLSPVGGWDPENTKLGKALNWEDPYATGNFLKKSLFSEMYATAHRNRDRNVEMITGFYESCAFKAGLSGVVGGGLGVALGIFSVGMEPPDHTKPPQTAKDVAKEMYTKSRSYAKSFAFLGFAFAGTECIFESYRGTSGLGNEMLTGCALGGAMGFRGGAQAGALGCAGFAAFSAAIGYFMHGH